MADKRVNKVVLAYSGGLDTSIILKWLQTTYGCEVVTFTADLGQGEELEPARRKAELLGIKPKTSSSRTCATSSCATTCSPCSAPTPSTRACTCSAPPSPGRSSPRSRSRSPSGSGADAVAHGATGKGNDQVRFELGYYALKPDVTVIAPWREWDLRSREALIAFAEQNQIPIAKDKRGEAPFSVDANLLHASSEGKVLEDPAAEVPDYVYSRTDGPNPLPTPRP
jgi:argininosuccinate synthase